MIKGNSFIPDNHCHVAEPLRVLQRKIIQTQPEAGKLEGLV